MISKKLIYHGDTEAQRGRIKESFSQCLSAFVVKVRFKQKTGLLLLVLALLFDGFAFAADLSNLNVTSSISPSVIRIGERIDFKVLVESEKGIDLFYPDESAQIAPFEVLKQKVTTRNRGSKSYTEIIYAITTFETGDFVIPPILITFKDRFGNERNIRTIEHKVTVNTGAAVGSDIIDILPPMEVSESRQYLKKALSYLPYIIPFLSALTVIIFLLLTRKKPEVVTAIDTRGKAIGRLDLLRIDEAELTALYFEISEIFRTFLHEHMKIDALQMTSGELLLYIKKIKNGTLSDEAVELFHDLDLVKFSPFTPSLDDAEHAILRAKRLIWGIP